MIFSYNWLQTYFAQPLPTVDELVDLLTMYIFEVDGVEHVRNAEGAVVDTAIDVKILPDRAGYAYAHAHLAREIGAFVPASFKHKIWEDIASTDSLDLNSRLPAVSIEDYAKVPYFTNRLITDITNTDSPAWLHDALTAVGQRSISLIVDLTNYVMLDTGQPMHAFDADKIKGNIYIRYAKEGEKVTILDGREIMLDPTILVIADDEGALDIAGIKGGKKAEVDRGTKNILITAGNFNSTYIRKTSQKVGIKNDATKRYENAVTLERTVLAQKEFITLLLKECAQIHASELRSYHDGSISTFPAHPSFVVHPQFVSEKIGVQVSAEEIVSVLKKLEIGAEAEGDEVRITPPEYRADIKIPEDIVEEVARLKLINTLPVHELVATSAVPLLPSFYFSNVVRALLIGTYGFSEIYSHSVVDQGDIELANPLTSERSHMRNEIVPELIKALRLNIQHLDVLGSIDAIAQDVRMFEIGHVFKNKKETWSLAFGIALKDGKKSAETKKLLIEEVVDAICTTLGIAHRENLVHITEGVTPPEGGAVPVSYIAAEIEFEEVLSGISVPDVKDENVYSTLNKLSHLDRKYVPYSNYPYMVRDIAVFIPGKSGRAHELRDLILATQSPVIVKSLVRKFDEFEKKNKETGEVEKTSYGYRIVFQAPDRTLTDSEVQVVMDNILEGIKSKGDWEVR